MLILVWCGLVVRWPTGTCFFMRQSYLCHHWHFTATIFEKDGGRQETVKHAHNMHGRKRQWITVTTTAATITRTTVTTSLGDELSRNFLVFMLKVEQTLYSENATTTTVGEL